MKTLKFLSLVFTLSSSAVFAHSGNYLTTNAHACMNKTTQAVRVVTITTSCNNTSEVPVHWLNNSTAANNDIQKQIPSYHCFRLLSWPPCIVSPFGCRVRPHVH